MRPLTSEQRDEFLDKAAMMAMQGILAGRKGWKADYPVETIASDSYAIGKYLLAERDRRSEEK